MGINLLRDKVSTMVNYMEDYSRALSLWRHDKSAINYKIKITSANIDYSKLIVKLDLFDLIKNINLNCFL
jgi:hypothetical protein